MKKKLIPLFLVASVSLTACNDEQLLTGTPVKEENAIASVNGQYIGKASLEQLEKEIAQRSRGQSFPKDKLVEELVQRELLVQDAIKKQLHKSPEFTERLSAVHKSLLSQAVIQDYIKANPVSDAELKAEYDKNMAQTGDEYKARHILVKTEDEANKIIAELKKGADFSELAKTKSTGPSGPKGGDLGWFAAGQMVPPFSEAVIALADNKFTETPVKTQFGYHVILREGSRTQTPPPFESVKEQIRPLLQRKKMQDYMGTLREQAKVEILTPKEDVPVEAKTPAISQPVSSNKVVEKTTEKASTAIKKVEEKAVKTVDTVIK